MITGLIIIALAALSAVLFGAEWLRWHHAAPKPIEDEEVEE